jgi:hypothetical protein
VLGLLVGARLFIVGARVGLAVVGGGDTNLITGCSDGYVDGCTVKKNIDWDSESRGGTKNQDGPVPCDSHTDIPVVTS